MLLTLLYGVLGFTIFGFLSSRIFKRNDIADVLWGLGFIFIALLQALETETLTFRAKIVLSLILIWGLRLAIYLGKRTFSKKEEDIRYANWRKGWGSKELIFSFLQVFLLQGFFMGIIATSLVWSIRMPEVPLTAFDFLGLCLFVLGFLFETISDYQMAQFKNNPANKGKILSEGLWAYSRHPNYFGEMLIWLGFFFISVNVEQGLYTIVSPMLICFLLLKVSGVPMLEKVMSSKGKMFSSYLANTPAILPFNFSNVIQFFSLFFILIILDCIWLGYFMKSFYLTEASKVGRIKDGNWDVLLWPTIGVYFFLSLGIQVFAIKSTQNKAQSVFLASLFGLCVYSVYEYTNLALIANWPWKMAFVDIIWGGVLCGVSTIILNIKR